MTMRKNPKHYLTAEQMRLLARHEGISVEELKKKFDRLMEKSGAKKAAPKRSAAKARTRTAANPKKRRNEKPFGKIRRNPGHSLMSEAAERYHNGEFDSMPSALSHVAAERRGE